MSKKTDLLCSNCIMNGITFSFCSVFVPSFFAPRRFIFYSFFVILLFPVFSSSSFVFIRCNGNSFGKLLNFQANVVNNIIHCMGTARHGYVFIAVTWFNFIATFFIQTKLNWSMERIKRRERAKESRTKEIDGTKRDLRTGNFGKGFL